MARRRGMSRHNSHDTPMTVFFLSFFFLPKNVSHPPLVVALRRLGLPPGLGSQRGKKTDGRFKNCLKG